jgi:hypothetical protein
MVRGNGLYLMNTLGGDESSSLRERLKALLQSENHAFEHTAVDHIGEWMAIEDSMKIGDESQSPSDLSETSKEDSGARHLCTG